MKSANQWGFAFITSMDTDIFYLDETRKKKINLLSSIQFRCIYKMYSDTDVWRKLMIRLGCNLELHHKCH